MANFYGTHKLDPETQNCACGATRYQILDNIVPPACPNAPDPKLIERIARAMCKADGNDPDAKCLRPRHVLLHLGGVASGIQCAPHETELRLAWTLYAGAAETAILELEAAAMDGDRAHMGNGDTGAPWYPPHLYSVKAGKVSPMGDCAEPRTVLAVFAKTMVGGVETTHDFHAADNCARCGVRREPVADGLVSPDCPYPAEAGPIFVDPQSMLKRPRTAVFCNVPHPCPTRNASTDDGEEARELVNQYTGEMAAIHDGMHRLQDEEKEAFARVINEGLPEELDVKLNVPAPKDAPLIEALRRQREKDRF